jgi:formylglycine-generating enzyme required for sulfatase activity
MASLADRGPAPAPGEAPHPGMVWVPGGAFGMGADDSYPEEAPAHEASVEDLWMDRHAITNADFARFVAATHHLTLAERAPEAADYPGADPAQLVPGSSVFVMPRRRVDLRDPYQWWEWVPGASWRHPQGSGTSVKRRAEHPVVHVAYEDAEAYAAWAGKSLPTEAEWERAARGGIEGAAYAWGDELTPGGRHLMNVWQGEFPIENRAEDGFEGTAPVGSFPPNAFGLHEMTGNVWEWTTGWWAGHGAAPAACCGAPERSADAAQPGPPIPRRVIKGGSHLCAENYCRRYRPAARMAQTIDTSTSHLGFRCVVRPG